MAVSGNLRDLTLAGLISLNCTEAVRARLRLRRGDAEADLYFDRGQIVHAIWDGRVGDEVVHELLTWRDATFELERGVAPPAHTVLSPWSRLVLEGIRLLDESEPARALSPALVAESTGRPAANGNGAGHGTDGTGNGHSSPARGSAAQWTAEPTASTGDSAREAAGPVAREREKEAPVVQAQVPAPVSAHRTRVGQMTAALADLIADSDTVEGGAVVTSDGLVLAVQLPSDRYDSAELGTLGAALGGLCRRGAEQFGRGECSRVLVQASRGSLIVTAVDQRHLLIGLVQTGSNVGLVFAEIRQAAQRVAQIAADRSA